MLRIPLLVAVALSVAFGLGLWSTVWALRASVGFGAIRVGAWSAFPLAQTAEADPYARSHRATSGRLLYGSAEGLSFTASTDEEGRPLISGCTYEISGTTPVARMWTLFAIDRDGHPLDTAFARPTALNSRIVLRAADGSIRITAATTAQPGNWLAVPAVGEYALKLTLLDTPVAGDSGLIGIDMPKIRRSGCGNA